MQSADILCWRCNKPTIAYSNELKIKKESFELDQEDMVHYIRLGHQLRVCMNESCDISTCFSCYVCKDTSVLGGDSTYYACFEGKHHKNKTDKNHSPRSFCQGCYFGSPCQKLAEKMGCY